MPYGHTMQGNLIQGKAQLALKNVKNLFGDQKEDSLTSLETFPCTKGYLELKMLIQE